MPATVNVNFRTVVHASSNGMAMSFPDVCKTPAPPAPPVPIPYPNIAMSSDLADGSSTVKVDGKPIMLKGSNLSTSTGDEAGSAGGGVVSSQNKGKALPIMYSFDVKVDGQNVVRLADPMQTNASNPANSVNPAVVQPPVVIAPSMEEPCVAIRKKIKEQQQQNTAWDKSGIVPDHRPKIQKVTKQLKIIAYFRQTKDICREWIEHKHMPKPHAVLTGTTITKDHLEAVQKWLDAYFAARDKDRAIPAASGINRTAMLIGSGFFSRKAEDYLGVVGTIDGPGRRPMLANSIPKIDLAKHPLPNQFDYQGKFITADYDLFELLAAGDGCEQVTGPRFMQFMKEINKELGWDAIQHPAQAQWVPHEGELDEGLPRFNMQHEVKAAIGPGGSLDRKVKLTGPPSNRAMAVIDKPLTVVYGGAAASLDDEQQVADALRCKECDQ